MVLVFANSIFGADPADQLNFSDFGAVEEYSVVEQNLLMDIGCAGQGRQVSRRNPP